MTGAGTAYDTIVEALRRLGLKVLERGSQARAQCPAHASRSLTLSLSRSENGVGVHCFAGCDPADVTAALGLTLRDLFDHVALDCEDVTIKWRSRPRRRNSPGPLGDPEHFCDRILQQERLEADPDWRARRVAEQEAARPAPGDYLARAS